MFRFPNGANIAHPMIQYRTTVPVKKVEILDNIEMKAYTSTFTISSSALTVIGKQETLKYGSKKSSLKSSYIANFFALESSAIEDS